MQNKIEEVRAAVAASKTPASATMVKTKVEKVPLRLDMVNTSQVAMSDPPSALNGRGVVIVITDGEYTRQITIHKPIGSTDLPVESWVATRTSEVATYLSNAVDPSREKKAQALKKARDDYLASKNFIVIRNDKRYFLDPNKGELCIEAEEAAAKVAYSAAEKQAKQDYLAQCLETKTMPKKDWKFGQNWRGFISSELRDFEEACKKALKADAAWEAKEKSLTPKYVTLGGPNMDKPQERIGLDKKNVYDHRQLVDVLSKHVYNSLSYYAVPAEMPEKIKLKLEGLSAEESVKSLFSQVFKDTPSASGKSA